MSASVSVKSNQLKWSAFILAEEVFKKHWRDRMSLKELPQDQWKLDVAALPPLSPPERSLRDQ